MKDIYQSAHTIITRLFMAVVYIACIVIPLSLFVQVIFRYFLNNPLQGIEELATFCFKCLVIFGSAVLFREKKHIIVDVFFQKFDARGQRVLTFGNNLIMAAVIVILIYSSIKAVPIQKFYASVALGIPRSLYTILFIISLSYMFICTVETMVQVVRMGRAHEA